MKAEYPNRLDYMGLGSGVETWYVLAREARTVVPFMGMCVDAKLKGQKGYTGTAVDPVLR